ncbi:MAG: penicillin-binding protein 2 [Candidatus Omnitrophica bacterium]|nr:penicillin-binding protein 2 [Candidatus Omnitrophota bacterium]
MLIRKHVLRFIFIYVGLIAFLIFFGIKLALIQVFHAEHLAIIAKKQHNHFIEIEPIRGSILDRNSRLLAFNVSVYSLFANPRMMSAQDKQKMLEVLPGTLNISPRHIQQRLNKDKLFVWIKRKLSVDIVDRIKSFNIKKLGFRKESKRFYPNGQLAAHIIGFAGIDNQGLEGLELSYNSQLEGESGWVNFLRDAHQKELLLDNNFLPPRHGFHLVLTIDETIQYLAEKSLKAVFEKYKAIAASIVVIDVKTGEILALANEPTYDLQNVRTSELAHRTNRAVSFVYEPGSVFKFVAAAAALEERIFSETDKIYCENGKYRVGNHILHDHRPHATLTFREVIEVSSNIGVTKIAEKIGPNIFYKYAKRFRFGQKTNIDLLGEVGGNLKPPARWSKTSIGAIPIGHEVTVTPLQLACALGAVANDGLLMKPYIVKYIKDNQDQIIKGNKPQVVGRVISSDTARRLRAILTGVVDEGTGKNARIDGVKVAGKTGTAQKVIDKKYSHSKFVASFIGFAPSDNPRIAAVVMVDEPRPQYYGGTVAAPVFKEVVENTLKYLELNR